MIQSKKRRRRASPGDPTSAIAYLRCSTLAAALADLRLRGAGILVVAKRDRLARDIGVAALIERRRKP